MHHEVEKALRRTAADFALMAQNSEESMSLEELASGIQKLGVGDLTHRMNCLSRDYDSIYEASFEPTDLDDKESDDLSGAMYEGIFGFVLIEREARLYQSDLYTTNHDLAMARVWPLAGLSLQVAQERRRDMISFYETVESLLIESFSGHTELVVFLLPSPDTWPMFLKKAIGVKPADGSTPQSGMTLARNSAKKSQKDASRARKQRARRQRRREEKNKEVKRQLESTRGTEVLVSSRKHHPTSIERALDRILDLYDEDCGQDALVPITEESILPEVSSSKLLARMRADPLDLKNYESEAKVRSTIKLLQGEFDFFKQAQKSLEKLEDRRLAHIHCPQYSPDTKTERDAKVRYVRALLPSLFEEVEDRIKTLQSREAYITTLNNTWMALQGESTKQGQIKRRIRAIDLQLSWYSVCTPLSTKLASERESLNLQLHDPSAIAGFKLQSQNAWKQYREALRPTAANPLIDSDAESDSSFDYYYNSADSFDE